MENDMQALWIAYDIVIDDQIVELLDDMGVVGFTRWPRLNGRGPDSGARLDNHVWPGANAAVVTVQPEETVARLMERLRALHDQVGEKTGIWAFTTPVIDTLN